MKLVEMSVYNEAGRVTSFITVPESMANLQTDNVVYGRVDPATEYVLDRTATPRPPCPATLSDLVLSGVVQPCTLFINDTPFEVTSDTVTLSFTNPGVYRLRLVKWPYLDGSFEVAV